MMAHENGVIRRLVTVNKSTFSKTFAQYAEQYKTQQMLQQRQEQQKQDRKQQKKLLQKQLEKEQQQATVAETETETVPMQTLTRTCILGCRVNKLALCRFPVHDQKRCNNWLKFFDVDADCVERLGGLANLRVCLKHFNQKQQMAKTRIKTTPTRLQKDALAATATATATAALTLTAAATPASTSAPAPAPKVSARVAAKITTTSREKVAATTTAVAANESQDFKRQHLNGQQQLLRSHRSTNGSSTHAQESLKRTTSMSSATSTHSHTSDTHSNASDTECAPATTAHGGRTVIGHTADQGPAQAQANGKGLLAKLSSGQGRRKVYMITERSPDESSAQAQTSAQPQGKRKMYLIMEEQNGDAQAAATAAALPHKSHTAQADSKRKKLTLYTDHPDQTDAVQLTQKFEQILPEILSRIEATESGASQLLATAQPKQQQQQQPQQREHQHQVADNDVPWEKLPAVVLNVDEKQTKPAITLPPKKNRTKITQADDDIHTEGQNVIPMAAITVRTSADILKQSADESSSRSSSNNNNNADTTGAVLTPINRKVNGQSGPVSHAHGSLNSEKQINLSSDFLFLMKMLPKLEAIPEPQKQQVKNCIEDFINQSANHCKPY